MTDRLRGPAQRLATLLGDDGLFGRSIAAVVLVSTWVATWRPQIDPDFGWHLRIGEAVLDTGVVPRTDTFSWLTGGQPLLAHSWAWDAVLAAAYRVGGLFGTSLVALPVSALAIGLLWVLLKLVAPSVPPFPRSLVVALGIVIGLPVWSARAQIWDVVFVLALVLAWSVWLRRGHVWALVVVPVIPILWVNLHGGATAFFACLLALLVAIPVGIRWGVWPRRPIVPLLVSTGLAIVAFAIGPYGLEIITLPFNSEVGNSFLGAIAEWQSPRFNDAGFATFRLVLAAVILVAFALRGRSRDPFLLLLAAGWTFLALGAGRFSIIAGPLVVAALAPALAGSARSWLGIGRGRAPTGRSRDASPSRGAARLASAAAIVLAIVIALAGLIQIAPARQTARLVATFPVVAVDWMLDRACHGRILNAYDWGGYLIGAWTDPVATYGSTPSALVEEELALEEVRTDVRAWLDGERVDLVLMPTGGALDRWLDETDDWTVAYRDPQATVHTRAGSRACPPAVAHGTHGPGDGLGLRQILSAQ